MAVRHDRHVDADERRHLARVHPGRVDDDLALDAPFVGLDRTHAAVTPLDARDARPHHDLRAEPPRRVGERERQLRRVEVAVVGDERRREHAVRAHRREQRLRLLRRDDLHRQPERLRPRRLAVDLLEPRLRRREPQAAELVPARVVAGQLLQLGVEADRVLHHPRERDRRAQLADEAGRVPRRSVRELELLDEDGVRPPLLREVVEARAADDPAADDDGACAFGRHAPSDRHANRIARCPSTTVLEARSRAAQCAGRRRPLRRADEHELQGRHRERRVRRADRRPRHRTPRHRPRERGAQHDRGRRDRASARTSSPPSPSTPRSSSSSSRARACMRTTSAPAAASSRSRRRASACTRAVRSSSTSTCSTSSGATSPPCASAASACPTATSTGSRASGRWRRRCASGPEPRVPCNDDLLAENFIDTGDGLRLIDYEYSGNNEPSFELGNSWSESRLAEEQLHELVARTTASRSGQGRARAPVGHRREVRLDALGLDPGGRLRDRVRLLVVGDRRSTSGPLEELDGPLFEQLLADVQREG